MAVFDTVLVANRGEIAVRVMRTLRRLGIRSVAVYSNADSGALHVECADMSVPITHYLDSKRIVDAAVSTGAQAIHPGYGFLSENPAFATACAEAGLVFIGPPASAIDAMGDKIAAKATVGAAGVPVVPGGGERGMDDAAIIDVAQGIGVPLLVKPSAGGGGKGMRLVRALGELPEAIGAARREARAAFGDDTLLVERFIEHPRHIEIQVLADEHGDVLHLGERECSLQRRHQKIIEEAPSALLTEQQRESMGAAAVAAARAVGYTNAGTVEFIVPGDSPRDFFFMEMNTRLQVEHPVTELVTGIDLVEWQLRIAARERLPDKPRIDGHAVEARIYAEDPAIGFLPSSGPVLNYRAPSGPHVRMDSGIQQGNRVGTDYDPMLAKVVSWAGDRPTALRRLDAALAELTILGVRTNIGFLRRLVADDDVMSGRLDTGLVERKLEQLITPPPSADALLTAALVRQLRLEPTAGTSDLFASPSGWRIGGTAWTRWSLRPPIGDAVVVCVRPGDGRWEVAIAGDEPIKVVAELDDAEITIEGVRWSWAQQRDMTWVGRDGFAWDIRDLSQSGRLRAGSGSDVGPVVAPMPGTVTDVRVAVGDRVSVGQPLVVVEAMKMEHVLTAPADGIVTEVRAHKGQSVAIEQVLVIVDEDTG